MDNAKSLPTDKRSFGCPQFPRARKLVLQLEVHLLGRRPVKSVESHSRQQESKYNPAIDDTEHVVR